MSDTHIKELVEKSLIIFKGYNVIINANKKGTRTLQILYHEVLEKYPSRAFLRSKINFSDATLSNFNVIIEPLIGHKSDEFEIKQEEQNNE